jgi:hypothetical protein
MHLVEEAQQAFYTGKLSVAHAFKIARLQPDDQKRALQECFPGHRNASAILKDRKTEAVTVRQLREWIEQEIHLDITHAPFDPQDEALLPEAGSCAKCPNGPETIRFCFRKCARNPSVPIGLVTAEDSGSRPTSQQASRNGREKPLLVSQAPARRAPHTTTKDRAISVQLPGCTQGMASRTEGNTGVDRRAMLGF